MADDPGKTAASTPESAAMPTMAAPATQPSAPPLMPPDPFAGPPPMPGESRNPPTQPAAPAPPASAAMATMMAPSTARGVPPTASPVFPTMAGDTIPGPPPVVPDEPFGAPPAMPAARYQLGDEIARGGMGRVVEATDTTLGRQVAFKEALSTDPDTLRRFARETRITARLEHPSIVPVHDAGASPTGAPFYVMRKIGGRPLERLVATGESLEQRLALIPHIVDASQAIAHAHERGIVHRDIKPSNILVGDLGETIVIDWGLAKVIGEADDALPDPTRKPLVDLDDMLKTRAGIVYGTPGFMAPEQLRGAPVDERCDVYALGATLYHLLSRKPPHHAKTADEMMKAAVAAPPVPVGELVAGVPPPLSTIVDKALAHDAKVRYQNARELAADLERFLTGQLVASHHYTPREKLRRWVKKNRNVVIAVATALVALLVLGVFSIRSIMKERDRATYEQGLANDARAAAEKRAEELTLTEARYLVETNPALAVAMVKPLVGKYWRDARDVAAAAKATGVAWGLPASPSTRSIELSRDGVTALAAGDDGVVRVYDLPKRQARVLAEMHGPIDARFADAEKRVVMWRDKQLVIADAATGTQRPLTLQTAVRNLEVVGATAYWADAGGAFWQLDLAGTQPMEIPLTEPVSQLSPSPDGRWIALAGVDHLMMFDRTQPAAPPIEITNGITHLMVWGSKSDHLAVTIDQLALDVAIGTTPQILYRVTAGVRQGVAYGNGHFYALGATGVHTIGRDEGLRKQLAGDPVGIVESRGNTMVAASSGGLTILSDDGDRIIGVSGARVGSVIASPNAPYVLAETPDRLLLFDLDDIEPRRIADRHPTGVELAGDSLAVASFDGEPSRAIELATGASALLPAWASIRAASAPPGGKPVLVVDSMHTAHLVAADAPPETADDIGAEVDLVQFATERFAVVVGIDASLWLVDARAKARAPIGPAKARALGIATGRGTHPWIAAALADGTLWRKNLATNEETKAQRPDFDAAHISRQLGQLLVRRDGTVMFLRGAEVLAWAPDGTVAPLAKMAKAIDALGEAGPDAITAFSGDGTAYTIQLAAPGEPPNQMAVVGASVASMSPESGLFAVLEHGAIYIYDPPTRQRWEIAPAIGEQVAYGDLHISADGRHAIATTHRSLLAWTLDLPAGPDETARWLDGLTNATLGDRQNAGALHWK